MARTAFRRAPGTDLRNPAYLHARATLARGMRHFHESENLYRRVIDAAVRAFGARDPRTATITLGLADLYEKMGRHDEARDLCVQLIDNLDREAAAILGVRSLVRLTLICQRAGRLDEAMRIHLRAAAYRRKVFGDRHYKVGECTIAIAELKKLMKALESVARTPNMNHPAGLPRRPPDLAGAGFQQAGFTGCPRAG